MVGIPELYRLAREQNIAVLRYPMAENGSMSVQLPDGGQYIGMDERVSDGGVQERVHLSHELGHCMTGSFYNQYSAYDVRQRHENRADQWALLETVPEDALDEAVAAGHTELWDLAEFFGIDVDLMRKAVCWYTYGNVAAELYF